MHTNLHTPNNPMLFYRCITVTVSYDKVAIVSTLYAYCICAGKIIVFNIVLECSLLGTPAVGH